MEQMNESLVTDYYVRFGEFVYKHVHPKTDYLKGKMYKWINPKKVGLKRDLIGILKI